MQTKRILLIDDHSGFTRLLNLTLQRSGGYIVREENDGAKAWSTAREFRPDIVFCDVDMPKTDGGEVAQEIRNDPSLAHVPIVFLTTLVEVQEAGEHIGGFPFLAKPVSLESIVRCIEEQTAAVA